VSKSAKARAARLVRLVEDAIESGAFTPNESFFYVNQRLGPCGCVKAGAQFVSGDFSGSWFHIKGLSLSESTSLEAGYEPGGPTMPDEPVRLSAAFVAAGQELRKFHPAVGQ